MSPTLKFWSSSPVYGSNGNDILIGGAGDDMLYGQEGEDILLGNAGNDLLDGGAGIDAMAGGAGDDIYYVDDEDDVVSEGASAGIDTIVSFLAAYVLGANVENLSFAGPIANYTGTGNALDNMIYASEGDDDLAGGDGNDSFHSGGGTDLIDGGDGTDILRITGGAWAVSVSVTLGVATVVDLGYESSAITLTSVERIYFSELDESFTIAEVIDPSVTGTSGSDLMLAGNNLDNQIFGLDGDDLLRGGGGYDVLEGGDGHDTAWFSGASLDYRAYLDSDGTAWVEAAAGNEAVDWLVDMEAIYFAADDVTLLLSALPALGTSGNDALTGSVRSDSLFGFAGNDSLEGLAGNDALDGGEGDDHYLPGAGDDFIYDAGGDDSYSYELGGGDDSIADQGGTDYLEFGSGIDPSDIIVEADADGGYYLSLATAPGSVWIQAGSLETNAIEEVRFADTTVWTDEDLYDMAFGEPLMRGGGGNEAALQGFGAASPADYLGAMADCHFYIP